MDGAYNSHGRDEKCIQHLLRKPGRKWEDNIQMNLKEISVMM
jgi:hypothetical protein